MKNYPVFNELKVKQSGLGDKDGMTHRAYSDKTLASHACKNKSRFAHNMAPIKGAYLMIVLSIAQV